MAVKVRLFDGRITLAQQLLILLWGTLLVSVIVLWAPMGTQLISSSPSGLLLGIGQLLGLLATFFALTQFMLMGRAAWIERAFGLDRIAHFHRLNGYAAMTLILLHPVFITLSHAAALETDPASAFRTILSSYPNVVWALVAVILFVAVAASSVYIVRKHLKFETWYLVHLMVYLAITLASLHQFTSGSTLLSSDLVRYYWFGLYGFVALNLLIWRFGLPVYNFMKFGFRVSRVEPETPTVVSVYIKGRGLGHFKIKPGQFIMVRLLTRELSREEHPFTVSWIPHEGELRISVRVVGDYTKKLLLLKPGTPVVVSGPFGRLTSDVAVTGRRLFIAGGIGITPLRALAEEAVNENIDAVLLYANRNSRDVPLKEEIDGLGIKTTYVYSDEAVKGAERGLIDGEMIKRLVPDFKERDIYICGPPPMMATLVQVLTERGVPPEQIHYESFSLHST